jgi:hypothetical protein
MAVFEQKGTTFTFSIVPPEGVWDKHWIRTKISIKNPFINYEEIGERLNVDEMNEWLCLIARFLAGAFPKTSEFVTEKLGLAADFYPYSKDNRELTRAECRSVDCVMALRLLFKDLDGKFLSGIYTLLLHRAELSKLLAEFTEDLARYYPVPPTAKGKYLFVAVSPLGYLGCKYWYFDPTSTVNKGEYVWVRMGRHNTEQIVYVDDVRYFNDDSPYDPTKVKQILRKATKKEIALLDIKN